MSTLKLPGFTAEASLYHGNTRYQGTTKSGPIGELIQPAQILSTVYHPHPMWCLKRLVKIGPTGQHSYTYELGVWDPVTHSCV